MTREKRSIALCIIFTLITCGFYEFYWIYCLHEDINNLAESMGRQRMSVSGGMVILLDIVTCGIYTFYWTYKMGAMLDEAENNPNGNSGLIYILLSFCGLAIVSQGLMQDRLNKFNDRYYQFYGMPQQAPQPPMPSQPAPAPAPAPAPVPEPQPAPAPAPSEPEVPQSQNEPEIPHE